MTTHTNEVSKYFNQTDNYLKNSFDIEVRKQIIQELINPIENRQILDMGCGNGALSLDWLANNKVDFIDLAENMLKIVKQKVDREYPDAKPLLQKATLDSFTSNKKYDLILAIGLLAHLEDIPKSIAKLSNLLNKEGLLLIQLTDYDQFLTKVYFSIKGIKPAYHQINKLSLKELEPIFKHQNLKIKYKVNYSLMLPGLGLFSDTFKKKVQLSSINKPFALDKIILLEKQ